LKRVEMMGMLDLEGIDGGLDWIFWLFGKLMRNGNWIGRV
jgi:hypothetical protein